MFTVTPRMYIGWFDRSVIKTNWKAINEYPLKKAGLLVMRIARGSIRRRTTRRGKPSPAGTPPYSRVGGATPPFKQIFSLPLHLGTSVIVGMVGYGSSNPVPGLHEHGGSADRLVFQKGAQRRLIKTGRYGKRVTIYKRQRVQYPDRPFMWPALMKGRSLLPSLWMNSLGRSTV